MNGKLRLIRRIIDGDKNAFKELVEQYQRLVAHIVFKMISDEIEREDICQEVFVKVYKNLNRFRGESKLSTWIARIAYNRCYDYLNRKAVPKTGEVFDNAISNLPDRAVGPDKKMENSKVAGILKGEMNKLPPQFRMIITLYHLDEMSYSEIGQIMKLPEGTVKSYLFRSRKMLKEQLSAKYNTEEL